MSIEKKSLISTLKTTKKANVAKEALHATTTTSVKSPSMMVTGQKKMVPGQKKFVTGQKKLLSTKGGKSASVKF